MARQAGLSVLQTTGMSVAVFAGASQMMAIGMYEQGASLFAIILATFILNLRHVIMGTCIVNRMPQGHTGKKLLLSFGVTDEGFAIYTTVEKKWCTLAFYAGVTVVSYASWVLGGFIGAVTSDLLPPILTASLGIALYAMFLGLLLPNVRGNARLALLVVLTAVCNTLLSQFINPSWALIASTLLCALVGVFFVDLKDDTAAANEEVSL
jgi:4-azaleucine resistance transporter AzlC